MKNISRLLSVLVICASVQSFAFGAVILTPTKDALIMQENPDTNYGTGANLSGVGHTAGQHQQSYLQFQSPSFTVTDIQKIELFATSVAFPRQGSLWLITNNIGVDWDESTITWNNAPSNDTNARTPLAGEFISLGMIDAPAATTAQTVAVDLTIAGKAALLDAMNNFSQFTLVIGREGDRFVNYASLENTLPGAHPVEITVIPEPATVALLMGLVGLGLVVVRKRFFA